jgi:hypothetical protein
VGLRKKIFCLPLPAFFKNGFIGIKKKCNYSLVEENGCL